jgi:hypothetical protein
MAMLWRCVLLFATASAFAADLTTIGVTTLRGFEPALTGANIRVAQADASEAPGVWQVNPPSVAQPQSLFTWISSGGSANTFPNSLGSESGHAAEVGRNFYGSVSGVAPGVLHVDNYEANYFVNSVVVSEIATPAKVVNQSFVFLSEEPTLDREYDQYAARYNVLFISGVGNDGPPKSPSTAYNSIAVGALGGASSAGPTIKGRCKPEITVPSGFTSFSTPQVAGAAAILLQAAARGDGGPGTATDLSDIRMLKALLLNGAQKPSDWTNSSTTPLHLRHGAGVLNVFHSYRQLRGGRHAMAVSQSVPLGGAHLPPPVSNVITARRGWDFATVSSSLTEDGLRHYFFSVTGPSNRPLTVTLIWNRQQNQTSINNLDMFLYRTSDNALVASSVSLGNNLEHIAITNLPPGVYNLQIFKSGGAVRRITNNETYAIAFDFGPSQPPVFRPPWLAGGQFTAQLTGEPNQRYLIQAASALPAWTPVLTNTTSSAGTLQFSVPLTTSRFFRALELP